MRIYFGWWIVAITVLVYTLAIGASIQAYGVFVLPVSEAFGLSRAETNTGAIALNIGMALAAPLIGRLADRHSARLIMAISALVFAGSFVVLALSDNLWLSTLVLTVGVGGSLVGAGTVTSPVLVARWFTVHRGRAMAISSIGVSLGAIVVIPLIGLLIEAVGWRQCLVVLGLGVGAILLLLAALARNAPGPNDVEPGSDHTVPGDETPAAAATPLAMGRLLQLPQFWTIAVPSALAFAIITTNIVSIVPFAQGQGLSVTEGASAMSVYGAAALLGTLLYAWLGDRLPRVPTFAALCLLLGVATGLLLTAHGYAPIMAYVFLMGMAGGAITPGFLALLADAFGAINFGSAAGTASFLSTFVSAIMIRFGGEVFDRTGSYDAMFVSFFGLALAAAALVLSTTTLSRRYALEA
ncbi:MFS transporter [Novosphingobium sp. PS1R-30]|uniref:MFS transporter n=1 Tax=Novosphingobium anseongense TaxID=3133436 RepID=A0ABU8RUB0_9SPHN